MQTFTVTNCPVCGNKEFSAFLTCTDHFVSGEPFELKNCNSCGLKFTANIPAEEYIGKYYQSEEYVSHSDTSKGIVNQVYHVVRNYMLLRKAHLVQKETGLKTGSILDIGTGTGYFLDKMREKGWNVTGTEKSVDARQFSKKEFGLDIFPTEEFFTMQPAQFDAITLWHVLEHIQQIDENWKTFRKLLKPDGKLIVAVPNFASADAKHYKEFWAAYDVPRHIWHFSPSQMKLMGEKYGFALNSFHAMPFDSFYVSILSEKYKKSAFALLKGIFWGKISWLVNLFNTQRCSSVIYVFGLKK